MKSTDSSNPAEKTLIHKQLNHSLEGEKAPAEQCSASKLLWNSLPRPGSLLPALPGENPGLYLRDPALTLVPVPPRGLPGHSGVSGAQAAAPSMFPMVSLKPHQKSPCAARPLSEP